MRKTENILIRIIVMIVAFIATIIVVNKFQNRAYNNMAMEMEDAELPLVYINYGGEYINTMHGYTGAINTTLLRDSITPIDANKQIELIINDSSNYGTAYSYELRSIAGDSLIESGDLKTSKVDNGFKKADITIRMDLEKDMEYMLVFKISHGKDSSASYYTRVVVNDDYNAVEILNFVTTFNKATYDKSILNQDSIIYKYQQEYQNSENRGNSNSGLSHVTLSSTYDEIIWGSMSPLCVTSLVPDIKEIDTNYATIQLVYNVMDVNDEGKTSYYKVKEVYQVSAKDASVSLLNFDRYVEEYFDRTSVDANSNTYEVGITADTEMEYRVSTDNKMISFVREGQLWLYDYKNEKISMVFGFWFDDVENERNTYDRYNINIIDMKDTGDMTFAVYGYMNRDSHEGKMGISLYSYTASSEELKELVFVETDIPFEVMNREISRFTYFDGTNFYFILGDKVNVVNVEDKKMSYLVGDYSADKYVFVADDMSLIAFPDTAQVSENKGFTLMNLKNGNSYTMTAKEGDCLVGYGFCGTDFVYGVSSVADGELLNNLDSTIPSYKLVLVDKAGQDIKEYSKDQMYITKVECDLYMIYISRAQKSGNAFKEAIDDFITYKENEDDIGVTLISKEDSLGTANNYFSFPTGIYVGTVPKIALSKSVVSNKKNTMVIDVQDEDANYMVYDNQGLEAIFDVAGDAIKYAVDKSGIVVSKKGEVVYRKSETLEYNTIADTITHFSSGTVEASLKDCIYMTILHEGISIKYEELEGYEDVVAALDELGKYEGADISGLDLNMVFGYISNGVPVISRIDDGRYVMIVSYNDEYIRYYDPVKDEEVKTTRKAYTSSMEKWSSELYTYVIK